MKLLITGGTNFVSRFTAEHFIKAGHDVTVMNRGSRPQPEGAEFICCDRTVPGDLLSGRHFDAILDITAYTEEHVRTLLSSCVSFEDYILISSSAVYPETNPQPFSEDQSCGNNSVWGDYGMNKLKAEQLLLQKVPSAYILRPPYFYGIYENIYREAFAFDCALSGRKFYIPQNGEMKMQFFNVSDLCRFIDILLSVHPEEHIFNVGNNELVTIREWVTICYSCAGKVPEFVSVDKDVFQRDYFCFHNYEYALDVSRQNILMPDTIPLRQGLQEEFDWYLENPDSIYFKKPYTDFIDSKLL